MLYGAAVECRKGSSLLGEKVLLASISGAVPSLSSLFRLTRQYGRGRIHNLSFTKD